MAIAIEHLTALRSVPRAVGFTDRASTVRQELDPTPLGIVRRPVAVREPVVVVVPVWSASRRTSAEKYERRRTVAMIVAAAAVVVCGLLGFMRGGAELAGRVVTVEPIESTQLP